MIKRLIGILAAIISLAIIVMVVIRRDNYISMVWNADTNLQQSSVSAPIPATGADTTVTDTPATNPPVGSTEAGEETQGSAATETDQASADGNAHRQ